MFVECLFLGCVSVHCLKACLLTLRYSDHRRGAPNDPLVLLAKSFRKDSILRFRQGKLISLT
jgi:hypothetical protein